MFHVDFVKHQYIQLVRCFAYFLGKMKRRYVVRGFAALDEKIHT